MSKNRKGRCRSMDYEKELAEQEKNKPSKWVISAFEWAESIIMAVIIVSVLFTFLVREITVNGTSMEPTYLNDDRVMITAVHGEIKQGDVVIVTNVQSITGPIIKRVVATEGQTVDFDSAQRAVVIDGVPLDDSQFGLQNGITELVWTDQRMMTFPQTVPEGCVFVLGDNRPFSKDSRYEDVGMIDERNILGKVFMRIYPFDRFGLM